MYFGEETPRSIWKHLKKHGAYITATQPVFSPVSDAWNGKQLPSPNHGYGTVQTRIENVLLAHVRKANHNKSKQSDAATNYNGRHYRKPMWHPDRFFKHSPDRHRKRREIRRKINNQETARKKLGL